MPIPMAITGRTGIASCDRRSGGASTGVSDSFIAGVLAFTLQASRISDNRAAATGLLVAGNRLGPAANGEVQPAVRAVRCTVCGSLQNRWPFTKGA